MKHKITIGLADMGSKWKFVRTQANLDIDDKGSNALGWWIVEWKFVHPYANHGHARVEYPSGSNSPHLVLIDGARIVGVLIGFSILKARQGDNSRVFGVRDRGEFKLTGSNEPYIWQWISTQSS